MLSPAFPISRNSNFPYTRYPEYNNNTESRTGTVAGDGDDGSEGRRRAGIGGGLGRRGLGRRGMGRGQDTGNDDSDDVDFGNLSFFLKF